MRFFRFGNKSTRQVEKKPRSGTVVPFTSEDLPYIKHHGIRALCGLLMDRHSRCTFCPFCGDTEPMTTVLVNIIPQVDAATGNPLVALYFSLTTEVQGSNMNVVGDWAARVGYAESAPSRKATIALLDNGNYYAEYGHIANPTEGDHSSGVLDRSMGVFEFYCDPEPDFTHWQYWDSQITEGQQTVPELACIRLRGEWWIVDRDRERRMVQQVAALSVEDNPNHPILKDGDVVTRAVRLRS